MEEKYINEQAKIIWNYMLLNQEIKTTFAKNLVF